MAEQLAADLALVRSARIVFYHHSVGGNILEGMAHWDGEAAGGRLRRASWTEAAALEGPLLADGEGGRNKDPRSKIDAFEEVFRSQPSLRPDLAFMKFCYVDFEPGTDVDGLFSHYQRTLEGLKQAHPSIRFGHVTVPLFRRPTDLKSTARRLLGLAVWEDAANARRAAFNGRLRETFATDPLFDLSRVESTRPDGTSVTFEVDGAQVPSLYPGYTDDGGHLNPQGQRAAGAAAIRFAAAALRSRAAAR